MKQEQLKVRIKKLHNDAVVPSYAHNTDCGMDLTAVSKTFDEYGNVVYGFGLAFEIPEGYAGFIFPRSSNHKSGLLLTNCVGIVDAGYRGEVTAKFATRSVCAMPRRFWHRLKFIFNNESRGYETTTWHHFDEDENYDIGDRVAQMVITPYLTATFMETNDLTDTSRGAGGFGSTGK